MRQQIRFLTHALGRRETIKYLSIAAVGAAIAPLTGCSGSTLAFKKFAAGTWEITETAWEADQVRLTVRVTVETGGFTYLFYAYNNNGSRMLTPESNSQLRSTRLRSGETAQGELIFRIPRGDATLVLADSSHHQLSGLPIRG